MSIAFTWWVTVELLGLASAPLAVATFRNLPDRGWALTKPLGLLALGWLVWLPLTLFHALPFSAAWIAATFAVYLLGNLALLRARAVRDALVRMLRASWGYALATEALFAAAFTAMLWERSFTPAVVDTEKFMDVAFLAAIWRASHLPPPDPWLSGYSLNYYYFGHYLMALPAKLLGTPPAYAFNLAIGLTFALAAIAIYGVAVNIVAVAWPGRALVGLLRAAFPGALSAVLTLVAGNFDGAQVWLAQARKAAASVPALHGSIWAWWTHRDLWMSYDWWSPSRVLPNTINEFPAFSFVLADLHAHVLALPYTALAIGLAFALLRAHGRGVLAFGGRLWPLGLLTTAVALGGLYAINGWDLPTYLGLALLAFAIQQYLAHGRAFSRDLLINAGSAAVCLTSLAFLLYAPFYLGFTSPAQGIGLVPAGDRSLPGDVWSVFALPAFLAGAYLATRIGPVLQREALPALVGAWRPSYGDSIRTRLAAAPAGLIGAAPIAALAALTILTNRQTGWTLIWSALIVAICAALLLHDLRPRRAVSRPAMMATLLIGCAAGLVMICEVVYLRDVFGGPLFRMNTVFKFYYQVWLLLGVASGPLLLWLSASAVRALRSVVRSVATLAATPAPSPALVRAGGDGAVEAGDDTDGAGPTGSMGNQRPRPAVMPAWARATSAASALVWSCGLLVLLAAAAMYPIQAIAARTANLSLPRSLDGAAYMAQDGTDTGDEAAINWLNTHMSGDSVIVEAAQYNEYTHLGRVSAFTGLPTLAGWGGHETQWRYTWFQRPAYAGLLQARLDAVAQIYTNPDNAAVLTLLRQNQVSYVYVGEAERQTYPTANLDRFSGFLRMIYHDAHVTIYAVPIR